MSSKDLQRKWQEVAKTCALEHNMAPEGSKGRWEEARKAAVAVAEALAVAVKLEQAASKKWQAAREDSKAPASKPRAVLRLVRDA